MWIRVSYSLNMYLRRKDSILHKDKGELFFVRKVPPRLSINLFTIKKRIVAILSD